jgi:hypothetical protein
VLAPELAKTTEDAPAAGAAGVEGGDKDKKGSYVGIHSTGFRCVPWLSYVSCFRVGALRAARHSMMPSSDTHPFCATAGTSF